MHEWSPVLLRPANSQQCSLIVRKESSGDSDDIITAIITAYVNTTRRLTIYRLLCSLHCSIMIIDVHVLLILNRNPSFSADSYNIQISETETGEGRSEGPVVLWHESVQQAKPWVKWLKRVQWAKSLVQMKLCTLLYIPVMHAILPYCLHP